MVFFLCINYFYFKLSFCFELNYVCNCYLVLSFSLPCLALCFYVIRVLLSSQCKDSGHFLLIDYLQHGVFYPVFPLLILWFYFLIFLFSLICLHNHCGSHSFSIHLVARTLFGPLWPAFMFSLMWCECISLHSLCTLSVTCCVPQRAIVWKQSFKKIILTFSQRMREKFGTSSGMIWVIVLRFLLEWPVKQALVLFP